MDTVKVIVWICSFIASILLTISWKKWNKNINSVTVIGVLAVLSVIAVMLMVYKPEDLTATIVIATIAITAITFIGTVFNYLLSQTFFDSCHRNYFGVFHIHGNSN